MIPIQEQERTARIAFDMNALHDMLNDMYEHLVDREFIEFRALASVIKKRLKEMEDSLEEHA